ncbi:MAG: hypothetical protein P8Y99_00355 [Calditrichaceae bacterium]
MDQATVIPFSLPVKTEVMFTDFKGESKVSIEKRQKKLLNYLDFLKPFLEQGEVLLLVTPAASPLNFVDYLISGAAIIYLKRCLLVFTDRRILHIPTTASLKYKGSIAQIYYVDCTNIDLQMAKLIFTYENGKTEKFVSIPMGYRKKIKSILDSKPYESGAGRYLERVHLCPSCGQVLQTDMDRCGSCQMEFKNKIDGKKLSIIIPGGGYFYTRHPFFGISDAITEGILIIAVFFGIISTLGGEEGGLFLLLFFGILLIIEKLISIYHSNHLISEFIPKDKSFTRKTG